MKSTWIIIETDGAEELLCGKTEGEEVTWFTVDISETNDAGKIAKNVALAFEGQGYRSEPVALGLSSLNVFAAEVPLERGNRSALAFELEEFSPIAAEEFTCDSIGSGSSGLGCWIKTNKYREMIAAFESNGIQISAVSATLLWACQEIHRKHAPNAGLICIQEPTSLQLFQLKSGSLRDWKRLPPDIQALNRERMLGDATQAITFVPNPESPLAMEGIENVSLVEANHHDEAARIASRVTQQRIDAWFDFYRDSIVTESGKKTASRTLTTLLAGVGMLLLAIVVFPIVLANRYDKQTTELKKQQSQIYQQLFPGERVPVGIRRRLKTRADQLNATRNTPVEIPERGVVIGSLYRLLNSMPSSEPNFTRRYALPHRFHQGKSARGKLVRFGSRAWVGRRDSEGHDRPGIRRLTAENRKPANRRRDPKPSSGPQDVQNGGQRMKSLRLTILAILILLMVALPLSFTRLWSARSAYLAAGSQLQECKQLSKRIEQLQTAPELVSLVERSENQIRQDVVRTAQACEIPISRISTPVSTQIPKSPYIEQSTSIEVLPVELSRLVRFLKELTAGVEKHDVASIRLTEPRTNAAEDDRVEKWSAELTITSWTYAQQ